MRSLRFSLLAVVCAACCLLRSADAAQHLKQSTSVTISLGMFVETDGITPATGLTITAAEIYIRKHNGTTVAAKNDSSNATHRAIGVYTTSLDATDTNTVGNLEVYVYDAETLVRWRCFEIKAANSYDSDKGTDKLDVNVEEWNATAVPAEDTAGYPIVTIKDGTGAGELDTTAGAVDVDGLTASGQAAVEAEATDAIEADGLDHLIAVAGTDTDIADNSFLAQLATAGEPDADWSDYDHTTDSQEAIINSVAGLVWAYATRELSTSGYDKIWDEPLAAHTTGDTPGNVLNMLTQDTVDLSTDVALGSIFGQTLDNGTAWSYNRANDSLEALRDRGDAAWITATGFSTHSAADVRSEMDSNSTQLSAIVTDTDELQGDWTNAGRLDAILDLILADTGELQGNQANWATATSVDLNDDAITSAKFDESTAFPANDALVALNLDHLCKTATAGADMTTEVADNTILSRVLANGDTSVFDPSTDGLQPIRDRGDAAWITATGFMPDSEDGSSFTAVPWNSDWDAQAESEANDALVALHLDHLLAADYDPASKPGTATALLNEIVGNDSGVSQFTANALELAPTGGATAEQVWTYAAGGGRILTGPDNITSTDGTIHLDGEGEVYIAGTLETLDSLENVSTAEVNAQCDAAIETYKLDEIFVAEYTTVGVASGSLAYDMLEEDAGATRFIANALEEGPIATSVDLNADAITASVFDETTAFPLAAVDSGATQVARVGADGDTLETLSDQIDGTSTHTAVNVRTEMDSNSTQLSAIVTDTNELQGDWTNDGRLDAILDLILADTGELQTNQGDWATAVGFSTHSAADAADAVWNETSAGHTDAGKAGQQLWTDVDAILADTGELQTNQGDWATAVGFSTHSAADVWAVGTRALTDKAGFSLAADQSGVTIGTVTDVTNAVNADLQLILGHQLTDTGTQLADGFEAYFDVAAPTFASDTAASWFKATGFSTHSAVDVRTEMDSNSTQLSAIVTDTDELQGDWTNAGRLDAILDLILADTGELQTNQGNWATATSVDLNADAITASVFDETTAFPLAAADSGVTQIARVGADGDTLETLSDQIDGTSTHAAADVWAVGTRALTDKAGFSLAADQSGVTFGTVNTVGDKTGYALSAAGIDAIWDEDIVAAHDTADTAGYLLSILTGRSITLSTAVDLGSVFGQTLDDGTAWSYNRTQESLEALRARGDSAWDTATGFSTHSAADVWAVGTRILTAPTNITSTDAAIVLHTDNKVLLAGTTHTSAVIPTVSTLTGHTPQTGDSYAQVTHGTYGLDQLVRATTPANTLDIDGSGEVTVGTNNDKTGYSLAADAITASVFDESTAYPLTSVDSGSTQLARTGADGDTLETLSDQIDSTSTHNAAAVVTALKAATFDTISFESMMEAIQAVLYGKASVSGSTVSFKKRNGTATKVSVTIGSTSGERTASTVNP